MEAYSFCVKPTEGQRQVSNALSDVAEWPMSTITELSRNVTTDN